MAFVVGGFGSVWFTCAALLSAIAGGGAAGLPRGQGVAGPTSLLLSSCLTFWNCASIGPLIFLVQDP